MFYFRNPFFLYFKLVKHLEVHLLNLKQRSHPVNISIRAQALAKLRQRKLKSSHPPLNLELLRTPGSFLLPLRKLPVRSAPLNISVHPLPHTSQVTISMSIILTKNMITIISIMRKHTKRIYPLQKTKSIVITAFSRGFQRRTTSAASLSCTRVLPISSAWRSPTSACPGTCRSPATTCRSTTLTSIFSVTSVRPMPTPTSSQRAPRRMASTSTSSTARSIAARTWGLTSSWTICHSVLSHSCTELFEVQLFELRGASLSRRHLISLIYHLDFASHKQLTAFN